MKCSICQKETNNPTGICDECVINNYKRKRISKNIDMQEKNKEESLGKSIYKKIIVPIYIFAIFISLILIINNGTLIDSIIGAIIIFGATIFLFISGAIILFLTTLKSTKKFIEVKEEQEKNDIKKITYKILVFFEILLALLFLVITSNNMNNINFSNIFIPMIQINIILFPFIYLISALIASKFTKKK